MKVIVETNIIFSALLREDNLLIAKATQHLFIHQLNLLAAISSF